MHTEGIHSEEDEGTLMGGYRSISNDDAIDWLRHPRCAVYFPTLSFFPFLTALQTEKKQEVRADPQVVQGKVSIKQLTQVSVITTK